MLNLTMHYPVHVIRGSTTLQHREDGLRFGLILIRVCVACKNHSYRGVPKQERGYGIEECSVLRSESAAVCQDLIACSAHVTKRELK